MKKIQKTWVVATLCATAIVLSTYVTPPPALAADGADDLSQSGELRDFSSYRRNNMVLSNP